MLLSNATTNATNATRMYIELAESDWVGTNIQNRKGTEKRK